MHIFSDFPPLQDRCPPFGIAHAGGIEHRPPVIYPDDYEQWPDLSKPINAVVRIEDDKCILDRDLAENAGGLVTSDTVSDLVLELNEEKTNAICCIGKNTFVEIERVHIILNGCGEDDYAGIGAGVMVDEGATAIVRDSTIISNGAGRSCTFTADHGTLEVHNSKIVANGGPLPEWYVPVAGPGMMEPPKGLGIGGRSRAHLSVNNSTVRYFNSVIEADGWAALSTDAASGNLFVSAEDCAITVRNAGYGVYADLECHVDLKRCDCKMKQYVGIIAGQGYVHASDCNTKAGDCCFMLHCVLTVPTEVPQLTVTGGTHLSENEFIRIKSASAYMDLRDLEIKPGNGLLIHSIINDDPMTAKLDGQPLYGIKAAISDAELEGDILHEDIQRTMTVSFYASSLRGGIQGAYVSLDPRSSWYATKNSTVVLLGTVTAEQIDAPEGVTITSGAGKGCKLHGDILLKSGGVLSIVKQAE